MGAIGILGDSFKLFTNIMGLGELVQNRLLMNIISQSKAPTTFSVEKTTKEVTNSDMEDF